jgi:hypothetical protein
LPRAATVVLRPGARSPSFNRRSSARSAEIAWLNAGAAIDSRQSGFAGAASDAPPQAGAAAASRTTMATGARFIRRFLFDTSTLYT